MIGETRMYYKVRVVGSDESFNVAGENDAREFIEGLRPHVCDGKKIYADATFLIVKETRSEEVVATLPGKTILYIVCEETGAHDPNGIYSAWDNRSDADVDAARLNAAYPDWSSRFVVSEMPLNSPGEKPWNW